jgi:hypothetical protein
MHTIKTSSRLEYLAYFETFLVLSRPELNWINRQINSSNEEIEYFEVTERFLHVFRTSGSRGKAQDFIASLVDEETCIGEEYLCEIMEDIFQALIDVQHGKDEPTKFIVSCKEQIVFNTNVLENNSTEISIN